MDGPPTGLLIHGVVTVIVHTIGTDFGRLGRTGRVQVVTISSSYAVPIHLAVPVKIARSVAATFVLLVARIQRADVSIVTIAAATGQATKLVMTDLHPIAEDSIVTRRKVGSTAAIAGPKADVRGAVDPVVAFLVPLARHSAVR